MESFTYKKCQKILNRWDSFETHLMTHYDSDHTCLTCGKNFKSAVTLARHTGHENICGLQCEKCAKTFTRRSSLLKHMKTCNLNELPLSWACDLCESTFTTPVDLERHRKLGNAPDGSAMYFCGRCKKKFCNFDLEFEHYTPNGCVQNYNPNLSNPYRCEKCGEDFVIESEFKKHFWKHIDQKDRKFQCDLCKTYFLWRKALTKHKNAIFDQEGKPYYLCDICGEQFCSTKQKKTHVITKHREKQCLNCGQVFSKKWNLDVHLRKQAKLSCKDCAKIFCTKVALQSHHYSDHK